MTQAEEYHEAEAEGVEAGTLPAKQELALRAVISHPTLKEAALAAGVGEATLWRYMRDAEFSRRLREARREVMSHAVLRLQRAAGDAVRTLVSVMNDASAGPWPRLTAARTVMDIAMRAHQADDLQERIDQLERFILRKQEEDALARARPVPRGGQEEEVA